MMLRNLTILVILTSCGEDNMSQPNPKKIPYELNQHGDQRIDNYYWMRDDSRSNNEIIAYLESENNFADGWFSKEKDYKTSIVSELMNQVPDMETSFQVQNNATYIIKRFKKMISYLSIIKKLKMTVLRLCILTQI